MQLVGQPGSSPYELQSPVDDTPSEASISSDRE